MQNTNLLGIVLQKNALYEFVVRIEVDIVFADNTERYYSQVENTRGKVNIHKQF